MDDEILDRLFALPPEEFIEARDNLAQQVRRDDPDTAAEVKALRKPTVAAWALNQVAHEYPADVAKLLAAGDRLRVAQDKALSGGGGEALRAATLERRGLATRVGSMAAEVLAESGRDETAHMAAISATLDAALRDPAVADALSRGRLVSEQEASGFGFGDDAPARKPRDAKPQPKPAKSAAVERAEHRADELTTKAVAARKEFNELAEQADTAEDAADEAEEAARAARKTAADLRRKATELRKAADRAENAAATLEQKAWEAVDKARRA